MRISLVIPVHNLEQYIEPLLCSLRFQVYDHKEIEPIFICDACNDRTHEIIEEQLRESFPLLQIYDREFHSSGLGRNLGIEKATGAYIWLLDGDDWLIDNHAISKVIQFFTQYPKENVCHVAWCSNMFTKQDYLFTVWQWVLSSEWAKSVKFTDRPYDDDVEYVKNWMQKNSFAGCKTITNPLYFYNFMREGSVMYTRALEEGGQ